MFLISIIYKITIIGKSLKDLENYPLVGWRKVLRDNTTKIASRILLFLMGYSKKKKKKKIQDNPSKFQTDFTG